DVAEALASGHPVVALESTLVAHGLPKPDNLRVAREIEGCVRGAGALPATVGVVGGEVVVGLDDAELARLASGDAVVKLSALDVGATLERLETLGVPVVGYRTRRFPGFYLTDGGHDLDWSVDWPTEVADILHARAAHGISRAALVVANPLPPDEQLDPDLHDR